MMVYPLNHAHIEKESAIALRDNRQACLTPPITGLWLNFPDCEETQVPLMNFVLR